MNRYFYTRATLGLACAFGTAFAAIALTHPEPHFIWNATPSAPVGLYYIEHGPQLRRGDLVAIKPPARFAYFMAQRRYVPMGIPLIKHVAAMAGDRVCRWGPVVTVNGTPVAIARSRDRADRPLPSWSGCRQIAWNELFLLNDRPDSLDGRYFGAFPRSGLIGRAHPLLTRAEKPAPMCWHDPASPN